MTAPPPTARIHLILARKAPVVAVFRRGPSRQVALLEWNLTTDTLRLGQWLKGRIYARRADLSPDGRHLIYFAANHRPSDSAGGTWTAISRMPFLTALHLCHSGHSWNDGGMFLTKRDDWLNGGGPVGPDAQMHCKLNRVMTPPKGVTTHMGEDADTYLPRLLRGGWRAAAQADTPKVQILLFRKPASAGWAPGKAFHAGPSVGHWKEGYRETPRLIGPKDAMFDLPDAESADTAGGTVISGERDCLMRRFVGTDSPCPAQQIADLNALTFTAAQSDRDGAWRGGRGGPRPGAPRPGRHPLHRDAR